MYLTISIPDDYREKIERVAKKRGLKKSDIAQLAIKQFVEMNLEDEQEQPYEKVKNLLGIVQSGIDDLGQHHHEHLSKHIKRGM